jgi:two-component system chemotaxis response regulator CheB
MVGLIVLGASFGGLDAISGILSGLDSNCRTPILATLHIGNFPISWYIRRLNRETAYFVREAEDKMAVKNQTLYFAPPNYHLMVEKDLTLSLSVEEKVNFSRPSVDVMFESAAWSLGPKVIGILLTGANSDGAAGLFSIKKAGGITIVQEPATAEADVMPRSAINLFQPDYILPLSAISAKINSLLQT